MGSQGGPPLLHWHLRSLCPLMPESGLILAVQNKVGNIEDAMSDSKVQVAALVAIAIDETQVHVAGSVNGI